MGMAEKLERAQLGVKLDGAGTGHLCMPMMLSWWQGKAADYVGCDRDICVKVEDEV